MNADGHDHRTDEDLADRILSGRAEANTVPAEWANLTQLVGQALTAQPARDLAREQRMVTAMAAATVARRPGLRRRAAIAAAALGAFSLTGGLAAAGALPGPAQDAASDVLDRVGLTVPDSHGNRGRQAKDEAEQRAEERKAGRGNDQRGDNDQSEGNDGRPEQSPGKGPDVSDTARDSQPGPDHGPAVCREASGTRCETPNGNRTTGTAGPSGESDSTGSGNGAAPAGPPADTPAPKTGEDASESGRSRNQAVSDDSDQESRAGDGPRTGS